MKETLKFIFILFFSINLVTAQDSYQISKLHISAESDDYAPYVWEDYLVFTSERQAKLFSIKYTDVNRNSGVSSLFKARIINDTTFSPPDILSKSIQSNHHDGPASFTSDGKKIYYARPNNIRNTSAALNDPKNFAGIYEAEWDGESWINIKKLPFSDTAHVFTHPAISPKGDFIVFASNLKTGKGNSDLYISRKKGNTWSEPESLGSNFNSKSNDFFPFIQFNGDLYFSSNKKGDFDIYRCKVNGQSWDKPVLLAEPINSPYDDYSIFIEKNGLDGYFSSNRDGVFDLYHFKKPESEEWECDSLIEESFCYNFPSVNEEELEGLPLRFEWSINGDKLNPEGKLVYCFPGIGRYSVKLNVVDTTVGQSIFTKEIYEFLVDRVEQPFIHVADEIRVDELVTFDASGTYLPAITINEYDWDFGDGNDSKGVEVSHMYRTTGRYKVSLTILGSPEEGIVPHFCSYKYINVTEDAEINNETPFNEPLDLVAFIRMIEYEPLPDDLYYLNLIGNSENVMMINFFNSNDRIPLSDKRFSGFADTTQIHIFQNEEEDFSYYYGATFNLRDAYGNLVEAREAGFPDSYIKNFKYTKLQSDEFFITPIDEDQELFAVVLKRSDTPIENFEKEFKKLPENLGDVREIYVEGEGYYYVVGKDEDLNEAFSTYSELKFNGFNSIRVKDFKDKKEAPLFSTLVPDQKSSSYMIQLFSEDDYLTETDSVFELVNDRKIISLRLKKKKVGYFVEGGNSLLEARSVLKEMKGRGFENALISQFEYEKLNEDGFFISKLDNGDFSYIISFDSSEVPKNIASIYNNVLLGYKVFEQYDPVKNKFYYQVDVGHNLPEAVLLSNALKNDSFTNNLINKLRYEPLNDDEFFIDLLDQGDEQYVLVLGSFKEAQNVYQTFKGFSSCSNIKEFYDLNSKEYLYIVGGYESLEEVFLEMEKCNEMGMEEVYIRKFVYDPLDPDQFYLKAVNEEEEIYRITLNRSDSDDLAEKSTDSRYDDLRDEGTLINTYDKETEEFIVAIGKAKSLPRALNYLGSAIEKGYGSVKVQRYIYSSMDKDRFVIRDINKEDRYKCVELFHSDSLITPDDLMLRELSRKYPISYSYNAPTNDYVYVMGPLENLEGALKFLEMARAEGFQDARIMSMVYRTLQQDEFYLEEIEDEVSEFVITLLKSKIKVDSSNVYFDNLESHLTVSELKKRDSEYYNYMIRFFETLENADSLFTIIRGSGYPNAKLELLKYDRLDPDDFTLETLSEYSDDFTVSLYRSNEKIGVDDPMFDEIKKVSKVYEYYNYQTKEFIYTMDKVVGMITAFDMMEVAKKHGFDNAMIDRFVYSTLNPDHFTLETIGDEELLFTIKLEEGSKRLDESHFKAIKAAGYNVREKYIPGKNRWTYSIGLTDNIAQAKQIVEEAISLGYENAEISRFKYMPLNEDEYYLSQVEDIETAFMIEIEASAKKLNIKNQRFNNISGIYKVSEVFDPVDNMYKYYAGKPMNEEAEAEAFRNELIAMGYKNARVSKFIYTAIRVDEYYLKEIDEPLDEPYVLEDQNNFEMVVLFGFDQYFLRASEVEKLKDFYKVHYNEKYQILLEGYTDTIGDSQYNLWLSKKRALSVKKYLLSVGVKEENITLVAKGETMPVYKSPNVEDYKNSRRVIVRSYRKNN